MFNFFLTTIIIIPANLLSLLWLYNYSTNIFSWYWHWIW